MWQCSKCDTKNDDQNQFCIICGTPKPRDSQEDCPRCGAKIPAGSSFCGSCGCSTDGTAKKPAARTKSRAPRWLVIFCSLLAVALITGSICYYLGIKKGAPTPDPLQEDFTALPEQQEIPPEPEAAQNGLLVYRTDDGLYLMTDADSAEPVLITDDPTADDVQFSPNGTAIYFSTETETSDQLNRVFVEQLKKGPPDVQNMGEYYYIDTILENDNVIYCTEDPVSYDTEMFYSDGTTVISLGDGFSTEYLQLAEPYMAFLLRDDTSYDSIYLVDLRAPQDVRLIDQSDPYSLSILDLDSEGNLTYGVDIDDWSGGFLSDAGSELIRVRADGTPFFQETARFAGISELGELYYFKPDGEEYLLFDLLSQSLDADTVSRLKQMWIAEFDQEEAILPTATMYCRDQNGSDRKIQEDIVRCELIYLDYSSSDQIAFSTLEDLQSYKIPQCPDNDNDLMYLWFLLFSPDHLFHPETGQICTGLRDTFADFFLSDSSFDIYESDGQIYIEYERSDTGEDACSYLARTEDLQCELQPMDQGLLPYTTYSSPTYLSLNGKPLFYREDPETVEFALYLADGAETTLLQDHVMDVVEVYTDDTLLISVCPSGEETIHFSLLDGSKNAFELCQDVEKICRLDQRRFVTLQKNALCLVQGTKVITLTDNVDQFWTWCPLRSNVSD